MRTYVLDASEFSTADAFYDAASRTFSFPEYFGRNLDALSDCLSDVPTPARVVWKKSSPDRLDPEFRETVFEILSSIDGIEFCVE